MAQIVVLSGDKSPEGIPLFRQTTTVGSDETCDIVLPGGGVRPLHAEITLEGSVHQILPLDRDAVVFVNGRKVKKARLAVWDVIRIGVSTLIYASDDLNVEPRGLDEQAAVDQLEKLCDFSRRLMDSRDLDKVLGALLDETLALTRATKGFLIFVENGEPQVKVARNVDSKALPPDETLFSESIVLKALADGQPQLVADALNNKEFSGCTSVINLKLASVMCVPLKVGGETLGVLYLGTERLIDLFDKVKLKTLSVFAAQAAVIVQHVQFLESLEQDNKRLKEDIKASRFGSLIGSCAGMRDAFNRISRVAPTDVPVLILGETGTGKELVAREIHARSTRADRPFVPINCGAIPENLLESDLFGHVRGAFTGATNTTIGKFQAASGGTLFLDEIGELPLPLQVKLLRVLQDGVINRVGSSRSEKVDVRLVAATNKDAEDEVKGGRFREDLYYRICVVSITMPPLRDRGDDVEVLAQYFLKRYAEEFDSKVGTFTPEAVKGLKNYRWPGNIRELENRVRKAVLFAEGPQIKLTTLEFPDGEGDEVVPLAVARERFETDYVLSVLKSNRGNRTKTARDLGVDPRTVFRYVEKEREAGRKV
ncbi:MAG: sigma 54-interacting transcriptional regulator [Deltaproteobacteria bacterium]|nr:sigma 54-interacting transcriptional regulator [Deltaproteobacteria bacterium]